MDKNLKVSPHGSNTMLNAVPVRVQRSRKTKQVSPNGLPIVYVGRPTKWGNPFRATDKEEEEREEEKKEKELLGGEPPEKKNDVYDFVSDEFYFFYEWLEYKKDRREKYKSKKSIEAAYNKLLKLSDGNPIIARQILENSYASNYAGFFPIKPNNQYNPTSQPKSPKIVTQTGYNGFKFD